MPAMIKPAFSTVACPDWTLPRVCDLASRSGYLGVELRTFGDGSRRFACEPALTDPAKIMRLFAERGLDVACIATGERFDKKVFPPVLGNVISDTEGPIRAAKRAIDLAVAVGCPLVRVFAYEASPGEDLDRASYRIVERLKKVVDHAHRTGVFVAIENGGSWNTAEQIAALVDQVESNLLGVFYNTAVGARAGDEGAKAVTRLGSRLLALRLSDWAGTQPAPLGEGDTSAREFVIAAAKRDAAIPAIFEWNRAWDPALSPAETVVPAAAKTMFRWIGESGAARPAGRAAAMAP